MKLLLLLLLLLIGTIQSQSVLPVVSVSATSSDSNVAGNVLDGNFQTRWSAQGDGESIRLDLGKQVKVTSVKIAFHLGEQRVTVFDVDISSQGSVWTRVYSGVSNGITAGFETFDVKDTNGRYVRIVGHGNSQNDWTSIEEINILGTTATTTSPTPAPSIVGGLNFQSNAVGKYTQNQIKSDWKLGTVAYYKDQSSSIKQEGSNKFLQVRFPSGNAGVGNGLGGCDGRLNIPKRDSYYLAYRIRFKAGWHWDTWGGKLPGLGGGPGTISGGEAVTGYNGWTGRLMHQWDRGITDYSYVLGFSTPNPPRNLWQKPWGSGTAYSMPDGVWVQFQQYVKMNTVGKKDGVIRWWADGALVYERTNVEFRKTSTIGVDFVMVSSFFGGGERDSNYAHPREETIDFDDFRISHQKM